MFYHAHIYFDLEQKEQAAQVLKIIKERLSGAATFISELLLEPRGPHPLPTFEIHFDSNHETQVLNTLHHVRGDLRVLIHQETGDDHLDHSEKIRWLGNPVNLNFGFFDQIKLDPSLKINP